MDLTIVIALENLSAAHNNCTQKTAKKLVWLLNYYGTNTKYNIRYHASVMVLLIHSDAFYLSEPQVQSRPSGFFYLINASEDSNKAPTNKLTLNGEIQIPSIILYKSMASTTESEFTALFKNIQYGTVIHTTLEDTGHIQPSM